MKGKKSLLRALLAAALCVCLTVPAFAQKFPDVPPSHWAYAYIEQAAADGAVLGYSDGTFAPAATLSLAHFTVILARSFYAAELAQASGASSAWYAPAEQVARKHGLLDNIGVRMTDPLSRYNMAVELYNFLLDHNADVSDEELSESAKAIKDLYDFPNAIVRNAVLYAYALGLLGGYSDGSFHGDITLNRAQAAAIYCRLKEAMKDLPGGGPVDAPAPGGDTEGDNEDESGERIPAPLPPDDDNDTPEPPDNGDSDVPAPPDNGDSDVPAPPDDGDSDVPAPPDNGDSDVPAPPDNGDSDVPAPPPDDGDSDVPAPPPDDGDSDVPAPPPDDGDSDVPAPPDNGDSDSDVPAPPPDDGGDSDVPAPPDDSDAPADEVEAVLELVNKARAEEGLPALTLSDKLVEAAQIRAEELPELFEHTRPDGTSCFSVFKEVGVSYMAAGENIAAGQRTPAAVMESWMNSSGHRANILSQNFGKLGVGMCKSGDIYGVYWVQMFTD